MKTKCSGCNKDYEHYHWVCPKCWTRLITKPTLKDVLSREQIEYGLRCFQNSRDSEIDCNMDTSVVDSLITLFEKEGK